MISLSLYLFNDDLKWTEIRGPRTSPPIRKSVFEKTNILIYLDVLHFRWLPTKNSNVIN